MLSDFDSFTFSTFRQAKLLVDLPPLKNPSIELTYEDLRHHVLIIRVVGLS